MGVQSTLPVLGAVRDAAVEVCRHVIAAQPDVVSVEAMFDNEVLMPVYHMVLCG